MKYFSLGLLTTALVATSEECGNDMKCICGDNYNKYFDGQNWIENPCKQVHLWPLDDGTCYGQYYRRSMTLGKTDPHYDQVNTFYYADYPLISEIGAMYNPYFHDPLVLGIPCGFNLRDVARVMAGQYLNYEDGGYGQAFIRRLDLRTPAIKYIPETMFINSRVASLRLLLQAFEDEDSLINTDYMTSEQASYVIELGLHESQISSNQLDNSDILDIYPNLRDVNLRHNKLTTLNKDWFQNNNKILSLNLANNQISSIPEDFFENLPELELVTFNKNQITSITQKTWKNTPNLNNLFFAFNQINQVFPNTFKHAKKLTKVFLGYNNCEFDRDSCYHGSGDVWSGVDFDTTRAAFLNFITNEAGSDNPGMKEQIDHWTDLELPWSRYVLLWARNMIPGITDERIQEFYDPQDTTVGSQCSCSAV